MTEASDTVIKLLVVEDHQMTLEGLQRQFSDEPNFAVIGVAVDAEEGLRKAKELLPDVVVLDLHLPKSAGPKTLVKSFAALNTKVLVLSAENRSPLVTAVMKAGAAGYVVKSESLLSVCRAVRYIHSGGQPLIFGKLSNIAPVQLSEAEDEILRLLARGMKYEDIAAGRVTAPATAKKQCERLRIKLSLANREQLIAWAINNGFGYLEVD